MQRALAPWVKKNFGDRPAWQPLLGVVEEVGELAHAHLKGVHGIRGTTAEMDAKAKDAVADVVIFMADYCNARGWDMEDLLEETFDRVMARDWTKEREVAEAKEASDDG